MLAPLFIFKMAGHECRFNKTAKTLDLLYPPTTKFNRFLRNSREMTLISEENCRRCFSQIGTTGYIFEKERQLNQYSSMIHPHSKFRQYWEGFIITETVLSLAVRLFIVSQLSVADYYGGLYQTFSFVLDVTEMSDEVLSFMTGYVDKETREVILEYKQIYQNKIRQFTFYFGFLSAFPIDIIGYIFLNYNICGPAMRYFVFLKIFRLFKTQRYWMHTARIYNWGDIMSRMVVTCYNFVMIVHWLSCLFYMVIYLNDFGPPNNKIVFDGPVYRYLVVLHMVYCVLFFQSSLLTTLAIDTGKDMFFASFFLLTTTLLQAVILGFLVQLYCFKRTSFTRYREMVEEARKFITQENLPKEINLKMQKYFKFRFRSRFFREKYILETLSPPLRREVANFLCYNLLMGPESIFAGISDELASDLCLLMKFEIFLPGDEVIREGKQAVKLYFVNCGSFSVYSPRGEEIQHLYNGAQFGLAAFATSQYYAVTVLALEMSECYSLKYVDFLHCASRYPEYIGVVTIAADSQKRKKRTLLL